MSQDQLDWSKRWSKVVAKAWADEGLKKRLLADSATVLKEYGLELPTGMSVHIVENTERDLYLVFPPRPSEELSEKELEKVAGGRARIGNDTFTIGGRK
ncbi:MAG TPA: NHLP leader peptide family RiPP precursor [Verrucomicrobiaceae bacterium]|jgi:hypothetical protein